MKRLVTRLVQAKLDLAEMDLERLLEEIQVEPIYEDHCIPALEGWFGVSNHEGIIAYFGTEEEALSYRLSFINRILNG